MSTIHVHPRIPQRHPDVSNDDVIHAMRSAVSYRQRDNGSWISVGFDEKGRMLEMVYTYDEEQDAFGVYHAMTPATAKTLKELGLMR